MGNELMARYAAEAQAEAKADRHESPKSPRRGDYAAQAILDYRVPERGTVGGIVESNRRAERPTASR